MAVLPSNKEVVTLIVALLIPYIAPPFVSALFAARKLDEVWRQNEELPVNEELETSSDELPAT